MRPIQISEYDSLGVKFEDPEDEEVMQEFYDAIQEIDGVKIEFPAVRKKMHRKYG